MWAVRPPKRSSILHPSQRLLALQTSADVRWTYVVRLQLDPAAEHERVEVGLLEDLVERRLVLEGDTIRAGTFDLDLSGV